MTDTDRVRLEIDEKGHADENGGSLGADEWAEVLARSTQPMDDPIAYADDCEGMG